MSYAQFIYYSYARYAQIFGRKSDKALQERKGEKKSRLRTNDSDKLILFSVLSRPLIVFCRFAVSSGLLVFGNHFAFLLASVLIVLYLAFFAFYFFYFLLYFGLTKKQLAFVSHPHENHFFSG